MGELADVHLPAKDFGHLGLLADTTVHTRKMPAGRAAARVSMQCMAACPSIPPKPADHVVNAFRFNSSFCKLGWLAYYPPNPRMVEDAFADLQRRRPGALRPTALAVVASQIASLGDHLSEKYLASGSAKEACELFAEAEDLLGQEAYASSQDFSNMKSEASAAPFLYSCAKQAVAVRSPGAEAEAAEKGRAALSAFKAAGSAGAADAARLAKPSEMGFEPPRIAADAGPARLLRSSRPWWALETTAKLRSWQRMSLLDTGRCGVWTVLSQRCPPCGSGWRQDWRSQDVDIYRRGQLCQGGESEGAPTLAVAEHPCQNTVSVSQ